ncbi:MAG TPA: hypothetical protein VNX65_04660 [Patescibacteria group bacterium]|jgi:cytoskeletal protein RodZ|nr:hypothetical protein [Patescibacteria group bacterium]
MRLSKQKSKRPFLAVLLIAVVLIVVYFLIWKLATNKPNQPSQQPVSQSGSGSSQINYSPLTDAEKQARDQQKQDIIKQQSASSSAAAPSTTSTTPAQTIVATISRASQPASGQPLAVRVNIAGLTSGECDIALSKDGQPTVNKVFPIAFQATTSGCQGSDIAASEFSVSGDWSLQVIAKNGSNQSTPVNQTITISK